jgi:hypothetical protein
MVGGIAEGVLDDAEPGGLGQGIREPEAGGQRGRVAALRSARHVVIRRDLRTD